MPTTMTFQVLPSLGDELALPIELHFGDLSQHEQTDGALILHRNIPKLTLCVGNLFGNPIASLGIGGSDDLNYECRALKYSADFTPDEAL